ncbi:MAG: molybdate ABC transporter substrate-binding protein [Propioniciclava sp.]
MSRLTRGMLAAGLASLLALTGCASSPAPSAAPTTTAPEEATLTVFAAASLTEVFTDLGATFEAEHPGVTVQFSFLGSSTLVDQLAQGAPADVFASANETQMDRAVTEGVVADPTLFASNVLTLVVEPGNPLGISGLDASLDDAKLVTCASEVPCGAATDTLSEELGVTLAPVSREQKVTDVLGKVTSGEADAGVVYVTDARRAGDEVEEVAIDGTDQVVNRYPIAVAAEAPQPDLAAQFVALVISDTGQAALAEAGFSGP